MKNDYAYTFDMIFDCDWLCRSCCPKKNVPTPCFPTPCCGDNHHQEHVYDIREINSKKQTTNLSQTALDILGVEVDVNQPSVGAYRYNIDTPYCCWFSYRCCAEHYNSLDLYGKRIAKITKPCYCTTPLYNIANQTGQEIGKITWKAECCFCCKQHVSVQDVNGEQLYGFYPQPSCCRMCTSPLDIRGPGPEFKQEGDVLNRSCLCVGCCHFRRQTDIHMPSKASDKQKILILAGAKLISGY